MLGAGPGPGPGLRPQTSYQPHCWGVAGGGREGGCLPERCGKWPRVTMTWRKRPACSHPGPRAAPFPPAAPAQTLNFNKLDPATIFRLPAQSRASSASRAPRIPGCPVAPSPDRRSNSLFPECSSLPSPTARPSRSSQNPRPSAPLPGPQLYPSDQGGGEGGVGPGPLPLRVPHCSRPSSGPLRATP